MPPHNIHGQGVGPYELSASFQKTLALLPNGPRVERFESDGLFDYRLMRTDSDALLLGVGRGNRVNFISVLDPDIARTESGIGVGAGVDELIGALGAVRNDAGRGRDPRIVIFTALPATRFIVEGGKVVAAVVLESEGDTEATPQSTPPEGGEGKPEVPPTCKALALKEREGEVLALADFGSAPSAVMWTCMLSDAGEAVVRSGEWVKVIGGASGDGPLRVLAKTRLPGLRFVALLNTGGERPALYSVVSKQDQKLREIVVTRHKFSGGRVGTVWVRSVLKLRASAASWLGARLDDTDFLVELRGRKRVVEVSGIFVQRKNGKLRNVVPVTMAELMDSKFERKSSESAGAAAGAPGLDAGAKTPPPPPAP